MDTGPDAMATYRAAVAFSIDYSITYILQGFVTVAIVLWMAMHTTNRLRRSPIFAILLLSTILVIVQVYINVSQLRDQVVSTAVQVQRVRYTLSVTLLFWIPYVVDFALIVRIAAFFPPRSSSRHRWHCSAAVALPLLIKVPRAVVIGKYTKFVWDQTGGDYTIAETVLRIAQSNDAIYEWSMMLADELYCTLFLVVMLWRLGWGWGDTKKNFSGSLLSAIRMVLISSLTTFIVPTSFLITLIALQVQRSKPVVEGYIFVTTCHISVIGAAFACLWPAIRAERRENMSSSASRQLSSEQRSGTGQSSPFSPRVRPALERLDSFASRSNGDSERPFGRYLASSHRDESKSMDGIAGRNNFPAISDSIQASSEPHGMDIELGAVGLRGSEVRLGIAGERIDPDETLSVLDYSSPSRYKGSSMASKVLCDSDAETWNETVKSIRPRRLSLGADASHFVCRPREDSNASKALSLEDELRQQALVEEDEENYAVLQSPTSTLVNSPLTIDTRHAAAEPCPPALASSPFVTSPFHQPVDNHLDEHARAQGADTVVVKGLGLSLDVGTPSTHAVTSTPGRVSFGHSTAAEHYPSQGAAPLMPRLSRFTIPRRPAPTAHDSNAISPRLDPVSQPGPSTPSRRPRRTTSTPCNNENPSLPDDGVKITTHRESSRD